MANVQDCDTIVSEFELQSSDYVYFGTNTFGKGLNTLKSPHTHLSYGLSNITTVLLQEMTLAKIDMPFNKETKLNH